MAGWPPTRTYSRPAARLEPTVRVDILVKEEPGEQQEQKEVEAELDQEEVRDTGRRRDAEQVDARLLYPRQNTDQDGMATGGEEEEEVMAASLIRSIEIMERSCFSDSKSGLTRTDDFSSEDFRCRGCARFFHSQESFARHLFAHTFVKATHVTIAGQTGSRLDK